MRLFFHQNNSWKEKKLYKLHNQLVKEGIEVISEESEYIHVSGHPNREDLKICIIG